MPTIKVECKNSPGVYRVPVLPQENHGDTNSDHEQSTSDASDSEADDAEGKAIRAEMELARFSHKAKSMSASDASDHRKRPFRSRGRRDNHSDDDSSSDSEFVPSENESPDSDSEMEKQCTPRKHSPNKSKQHSEPQVRARRQQYPSPNERSRQNFKPKQSYLHGYITGGAASESDDDESVESVAGDGDTEPWMTEPTDYLTGHISKPNEQDTIIQPPEQPTEEALTPNRQIDSEKMTSNIDKSDLGNWESDSEEDALSYFDRHYGSKKSAGASKAGDSSVTQVSTGSAKTQGQSEIEDLGSEVDDSNVDWFDSQFPSIKADRTASAVKKETEGQTRTTALKKMEVGQQETVELSD